MTTLCFALSAIGYNKGLDRSGLNDRRPVIGLPFAEKGHLQMPLRRILKDSETIDGGTQFCDTDIENGRE